MAMPDRLKKICISYRINSSSSCDMSLSASPESISTSPHVSVGLVAEGLAMLVATTTVSGSHSCARTSTYIANCAHVSSYFAILAMAIPASCKHAIHLKSTCCKRFLFKSVLFKSVLFKSVLFKSTRANRDTA